jgi:hypothetical protein
VQKVRGKHGGTLSCRSGEAWPVTANLACPAVPAESRIYNYRGDAGGGSNTITVMSESPGWRAALLGTVAAGALWLGTPRYARAQVVPPSAPCDDVSGTTVTCTGNISAGIKTGNPYAVLNVENLTTNITPASGVDGIYFHNTSSLTINSDTTPFAIIVTGAGADGIDAFSTSAITITHTGDIDASAGRDGIHAQVSAAGFSITSTGEITDGKDGIFAHNDGTGALTIIANGDVAGTSDRGIYARNFGTGPLSVTTEGVTGGFIGIYALNDGSGALTVTANGDVVGTGHTGILARNAYEAGTGPLSVTTEGVTAGVRGIYARNYGLGALTITANGHVEGTLNIGIHAHNDNANSTTLTVTSEISAFRPSMRA